MSIGIVLGRSGHDGNPTLRIYSQYKGVEYYGHREHRERPWRARLCGRHLGYWSSEKDAAKAYDAAVVSAFGEFARTNFTGEALLAQEGP